MMNKAILILSILFMIIGLIIAGLILMIMGDNVKNTTNGHHDLYIASGIDYDSVLQIIIHEDVIKHPRTFNWVAHRMNYPNTVEAGKYAVPNFLSNKSLVRLLRNGYGEQSISLIINTINSRSDLYNTVSALLETDNQSLRNIFENDAFLRSHNLNVENAWALVLCDTYQFYWDTNAEEFFSRMQLEFSNFWNDERRLRASSRGLSPLDCVILASIIEKESAKTDEYARIAGVYVNRLQSDWPLQADPTVKYALGQPGLKRVLTQHLQVDNPYNTYKYKGLPPGPIGLPEKSTIDAVLNAEEHDFMYFCAREDFSGYHVFSTTLSGHLQNARKYQKALDERNIH